MSQKTILIFISIFLIALGIYFLSQQVRGVTIGGNLNMGSNRITNLAGPTTSTDAATESYVSSTDAATRAYVDQQVAAAESPPGSWDCIYQYLAGAEVPPTTPVTLVVNLQCPIGYQRIVGGCNFWPFTTDMSQIVANQPWNGGWDYHNELWYDPSQTGWLCDSGSATRMPYARIWCCR